MKRAAIIYNPKARNAPSLDRLKARAKDLKADDWEVEILATEQAMHAIKLAREEVRRSCDVVFACGGDGTVNEVVNGLAGSQTSLGVIRGGMGDVFAKEIGVARSPEAALDVLLQGETRSMDLGLAGDRYFLAMCGVGFDAAVVRAVPDGPKQRLGSASYVAWGLRELMRFRSVPVRLEIDGTELEANLFWLLLGNTRSYGGVLNIAGDAVVDDALLDAYVFAGSGPVWQATTAARLALGRHDGASGVTFRRVSRLNVLSTGLPVQIDGEFFGETPQSFRSEPAALRVLLMPGRASRLFRSDQAG